MEIGNEISQKIRSAIKAKLVDLGVYVDDELPDYIMVMVANKKTQEQMTEDLNLFLGNNTEKFTSWLHGLLKKLQSIAADPKPPDDTPAGSQKSDETQEEIEEEELLIRPEHDDFEEEAKREAAVSDISVVAKAVTAAKTVAVLPSVQEPSRLRSVDSRSTTSLRSDNSISGPSSRRAASPKRDVKSRLGSSHSHQLRSQSSNEAPLQKQRAAIRKRRAPESVVGSVVHHEIEEEEYDPRRPLIGRVASTVRVGQRRPTVPPAQQANKSLLLKAMTEARDSIAKATQKLTEQVAFEEAEELVKPAKTSRDRFGPRNRVEPRGSLRSSGSTQRVTRVTSVDPETRKQEPDERSVQLYSRSKREEVLQQFRAGLHSDSDDISDLDNSGYVVAEDNRQVSTGNDDTPQQYSGDETERRTITIDSKKDEEEAEHLDMLVESGAEESDFTDEEAETRIVQKPQPEVIKERPASPKFVVTLDGVDPASMHRSQTDEEVDMQIDEDLPKTVVRVAPHRILTSTPELATEYTDLDFIDEDGSGSPPKRSRAPEKCKFWMNCRNGDQCPYHHPKVPCKAFPKCKFGDKCLYIHPNCKFEANCTRPNCPFTHRVKRNTQFTTPTAVPVVIQPFKVMTPPEQFPAQFGAAAQTSNLTAHLPPKKMTCKFFPKCTNMNCKYLHPKPCRYGMGCRDKANCTFSHPEPPSADKLKWTAPALANEMDYD